MRTRLLLLSLLACGYVQAEIKTQEVSYEADGVTLSGYVAWDDAIEGKRPGVLVVHEWWGHNDYAQRRARDLAELGYVGFALDMYGDGKLAEHPDDAGKFAQAVSSNFDGMKTRFEAAQQQLLGQEYVDGSRIAAIGYCFGGGVVLNMARAGAPLSGVVSFHGSLGPIPGPAESVDVPMLVLNGAADPFVSAEVVTAFKEEMDAAGADYMFVNYPDVVHSFTNPGATEVGEKFGLPLVYNADADAQSWAAMQEFFERVFASDA
ncbi:MAG: dienelactone hydrolase family protein [Pseudomonadota bacterium]